MNVNPKHYIKSFRLAQTADENAQMISQNILYRRLQFSLFSLGTAMGLGLTWIYELK